MVKVACEKDGKRRKKTKRRRNAWKTEIKSEGLAGSEGDSFIKDDHIKRTKEEEEEIEDEEIDKKKVNS